VVTLEWAADKADFARQRVSEAGLADYVEFKIGDALESIAALVEPLDFVLIDLCTDRYVPCLERTYRHLRTGALLVADNIPAPESARAGTAHYVSAVKLKLGIESITVPIGSGIQLSRFTRPTRGGTRTPCRQRCLRGARLTEEDLCRQNIERLKAALHEPEDALQVGQHARRELINQKPAARIEHCVRGIEDAAAQLRRHRSKRHAGDDVIGFEMA
jgi:hypothetical protein